MFGKSTVVDIINRSAENENDRRSFLKAAGLTGLGVAGAAVLSGVGAEKAHADPMLDVSVLNFALNLEYLEAEFYLRAVYGYGLEGKDTTGKGNRGGVSGGHRVPFKSRLIANYAREIAEDERKHVQFLRSALGTSAVARPKIDLCDSFTAAARAAGLIGAKDEFNPFANETNFLLAAFIFEDVGVTAYKGAAPLIENKVYLEAAAGILAVEAYHAGIIRTTLYAEGLYDAAQKISDLRDAVDGKTDLDQGIGNKHRANLVPADGNAIAFSRNTEQVLNIVYLTPNKATSGGFYPNGVNGAINTSGANG